ncbi:MAG TPA: hypothetical protein VIW46_03950 [Acidimicrobiia bacterium]|jgi:hypothetical protein
MLRKGQRVETLTKKTGQTPRSGVVIDLRDEFCEVEWDDGHTTTITVTNLVAKAKSKKPTV